MFAQPTLVDSSGTATAKNPGLSSRSVSGKGSTGSESTVGIIVSELSSRTRGLLKNSAMLGI